MPTNINTNYLSFASLVSRAGEDARVLPTGPIDFTLDTTYSLDLTATVQSANLRHPIQAVYIDASGVGIGATTLTMSGTGQRITIPAGAQGYFPLLVAARSYVFTVTNLSSLHLSRGTATIYLYFLNIPCVACDWSTVSIGGGSTSAGMNYGPVRLFTPTSGNKSDLMTASDYTVYADCSTFSVTEFLPPSPATNQVVNIGRLGATAIAGVNNLLTVNGNGALINGQGSAAVLALVNQIITLQFNGGAWEIMGSFAGGNASTQAGLPTGNNAIIRESRMVDASGIGTPAGGAWWRQIVDKVTGLAGNLTLGFFDVANNRMGGGFDNAGYFVASNGLSIPTPANISLGSGWQNWTPTVTGWQSMTISNLAVSTAKYLRIGPIVFFEFYAQMTLGGVASNQIFVSTAVTATGSSSKMDSSVNLNTGWQAGWGYTDVAGSLHKFELNGEGNYPLGNVFIFSSGFYQCA